MQNQTNSTQLNKGRLIIVSNRLPVVISKKEDGQLVTSTGSGGLVTALAPILKNRGGVWIGWPGTVPGINPETITATLKKENRNAGFLLHPVFLSEEEVKLYYEGFSNEIIWPLFHDLQSECHFNPSYWNSAQKVNEKFAHEINSQVKEGDFLWVHDYHLMFVGQYLRKLGTTQKIGFFLHIPFPAPDIFLKLPWRFQLLRALLEYDLLGFQTVRDQKNFIQCVKKLLGDIRIFSQRNVYTCQTATRDVHIGVFPISIDYNEFSKLSEGQEVINQADITQEHLKGQKIVFSCDRLDISKGIPYRLEAIRLLLKTHPELHEKIVFFQVIIPSRTEIAKYQELKGEIDKLVSEINSEFTKTGWVPIHYLFHSISRKELVAFYQSADIALITPVKDGMNLVAKEYVASNINENGVLILSEFAGTATQFQHEAILINPYDIEGLSTTIYEALNIPAKEVKKRMKKMRRNVQRYDVYWWLQSFLTAAISKNLQDFPLVEEFIPKED